MATDGGQQSVHCWAVDTAHPNTTMLTNITPGVVKHRLTIAMVTKPWRLCHSGPVLLIPCVKHFMLSHVVSAMTTLCELELTRNLSHLSGTLCLLSGTPCHLSGISWCCCSCCPLTHEGCVAPHVLHVPLARLLWDHQEDAQRVLLYITRTLSRLRQIQRRLPVTPSIADHLVVVF